MKKRLYALFALVRKRPYVAATVVAVLVVGGWYTFGRSADKELETLRVARTTFKDTVSVSGSVVAAQNVAMGFSQSGRVAYVYVAVGARVAAGQILAEEENGDLRASLLQAQAGLQTQSAKLAALEAGTRLEQLALKQAAVQTDAQALVDATQDAYRAVDAAVRNTLGEFINNGSTNPTLAFLTSDSNLKNATEAGRLAAETMLKSWSAHSASVTVQSDLSAEAAKVQSNLALVVVLLSEANGALNHAIVTTDNPQSEIDGYITDVASARSTIQSAVSAVNTALGDLVASQKDLTLAQAGSTKEDIDAQRAQVTQAQAQVAQAQAQLNKTIIRAPFGGSIGSVEAKVGQIVSPDTPQVSLLSNGTFQIESYVPEVSVAKLSVGQGAEVWLDAYGPGVLFAANVISIAPAETLRDGVSNYKTMLQFAKDDPRIRSGMTANTTITTEQKADTIVVPKGALIHEDEETFVEVLEDKKPVRRKVVLGLSSVGSVEIAQGLQEGEVVVLNP